MIINNAGIIAIHCDKFFIYLQGKVFKGNQSARINGKSSPPIRADIYLSVASFSKPQSKLTPP
jgi:hypothetical protein